MSSPVLPVDAIVTELITTLHTHRRAVLVAPPGTGKTTRLPLILAGLAGLVESDSTNHLHDLLPAGGRILITEPRRTAARTAAMRMASVLGERVGNRIGLRMRDDTRVSAHTIIEVVTEGVFLRMITADPALDGVEMVMFDETHERSLDSDVSMAMARYSHDLLRPDLRLLAMSATLDIEATTALFDAPSVVADVPLHPVTETYEPVLRANIVPGTVDQIIGVLARPNIGDLLVFLPGAPEIGGVARRLERQLISTSDVTICPLTGSSSPEATEVALRPDPAGRRKVILATAVAQTSVTIPGVRTVIDSALRRRSRFDAANGLSRLVTERSSKATSIQRAGRAGREGPGHVHRLLSSTEFDRLDPHDPPEIVDADLTEVALLLATWGITSRSELRWITPPPVEHWDAAITTLRAIGALDSANGVTPLGTELAMLPVHPRIGAMLHHVREHGDADTHERARLFAAEVAGIEPRRHAGSDRFGQFLSLGSSRDNVPTRRLSDGYLAALTYPDRIAARTGDDPGRYLLTSGGVATMKPDDPLRGTSLIVAVEIDGNRRAGTIFRAVELPVADLADLGDALPALRPTPTRKVSLTETGRVEVRVEHMVASAMIRSERVDATPADVADALLASTDLSKLLMTDAVASLLSRVAFARQFDTDLPDWSIGALTTETSREEFWRPAFAQLPFSNPLASFDVANALAATLTYPQQRSLNALAPETVALRERSAHVDYTNDGGPTVAAKLQDFLGMASGPVIGAQGKGTSVRLELLSPAQRPAAITNDLATFWTTGYPSVRSDLRGRYPKHDWPEDPLNWTPKPRKPR